MASKAIAEPMLRGIVKAVPSGDTLVVMELGNTTSEIPPERTIVLSSIMAPRLARRGGKQSTDEPFSWQSREFLRKLCIGKVVSYQIDYTLQPRGLEFGTVFLGNNNIASWVVGYGWAKVKEARDLDKEKGECSPHLKMLINSANKAMNQGVGIWSKAACSVRNLPPSAVDDPENLDVMEFLAVNKSRIMEAIVEYVRDGSTLHVYLLPDYQHVRVYVAGIQAPPMRNWINEPEKTEANGKNSKQSRGLLASAEEVTASSAPTAKAAPDTFGRQSKHFTELRVLHRDVRIVFEGFDKSGLIGSVYYLDGIKKDLAVQLVENGLAKYVERSAHFLQDNVKQLLKNSELAAKESRLRMWTSYMPPTTTARKVEDQNFSGKVVEVVSGDCILVATNSLAERRVHLSSIRRPRLRGSADRSYAREAKEFLRKHLIGRQVYVSMEYSRKANIAEGPGVSKHPTAEQVMDFGSIFVESQSRNAEDSPLALSAAASQHYMTNIAEMMVAHGFAEVIRHKDYEARSNHYEALFAAEFHARAAGKGYSGKDAPVITDYLTSPSEEARNFLPELQQNRKINAVVEYVFSGHRYKLYIPQKACYIAFSLSRVRCPGRDAPFFTEATAQARRIIMQRDVEIEVETVDRSGTFLGSLWESESNVAVTLLEQGLAKLQTPSNAEKITNFHQLAHAEQSAKRQKLKIWKSNVERQDVSHDQHIKRIPKEELQIQENCVEGQEVSNGLAVRRKPKEVLQVVVKEVLGGGKFYVHSAVEQKEASVIQQKLASLKLQEAPPVGSYNPKKGDLVIAQCSQDNSWYRAMIVNVPQGVVRSAKAKFEVFYIDYGTQEFVAYSRLRPSDCYSLPSSPGLAKLCSLAHVKVPGREEKYGKEAACRLSDHILRGQKFKAIVEEKDTSDGEVRGHGTGTNLLVTLINTDANISINAVMLKEGFARVDKRRQEDAAVKQTIEELKAYQEEAKIAKLGMWENGDIISDNSDENE